MDRATESMRGDILQRADELTTEMVAAAQYVKMTEAVALSIAHLRTSITLASATQGTKQQFIDLANAMWDQTDVVVTIERERDDEEQLP